MNETSQLKQDLYVQDVERLLKRHVDSAEAKAIKIAFTQQRSAIETAKLITGNSERIDRQNDVA